METVTLTLNAAMNLTQLIQARDELEAGRISAQDAYEQVTGGARHFWGSPQWDALKQTALGTQCEWCGTEEGEMHVHHWSPPPQWSEVREHVYKEAYQQYKEDHPLLFDENLHPLRKVCPSCRESKIFVDPEGLWRCRGKACGARFTKPEEEREISRAELRKTTQGRFQRWKRHFARSKAELRREITLRWLERVIDYMHPQNLATLCASCDAAAFTERGYLRCKTCQEHWHKKEFSQCYMCHTQNARPTRPEKGEEPIAQVVDSPSALLAEMDHGQLEWHEALHGILGMSVEEVKGTPLWTTGRYQVGEIITRPASRGLASLFWMAERSAWAEYRRNVARQEKGVPTQPVCPKCGSRKIMRAEDGESWKCTAPSRKARERGPCGHHFLKPAQKPAPVTTPRDTGEHGPKEAFLNGPKYRDFVGEYATRQLLQALAQWE